VIAFRSILGTQGAQATNLVLDLPAGHVAGDLLIAIVVGWKATPPSAHPATPSGWTLMESDIFAGARHVGDVYARVDTGSLGSTVTFVYPTAHYASGVVAAYSGAGSVEASEIALRAGGTSVPFTAAAMTTLSANAMVVLIGMNQGGYVGSVAPPAGYTERLEFGDSNLNTLMWLADAIQASAGAIGSPAFSNIATPQSDVEMVSLALAEPGGGAAAFIPKVVSY
jgi:hypothetical protein